MIDLSGIIGIPLLKKSRFTGSDKTMNYVLEKHSEGDDISLAAIYWHGPFCSDKTLKEEKEEKRFPFTEEGLAQAVTWLNEQNGNYKVC